MAIGTCETQGLRETMTLLRGLLGGCKGQAVGGSRTKTSNSRQFVMLGRQNGCAHAVTAKRANNQGENVHISNYSTTPIVLIFGVRGQLRDCSNSVRLIVFFPDSSFKLKHYVNFIIIIWDIV